MLAVVVALSMVIIVLVGSLLGMCLPFVLDRLGWDPATASAPLVTTLIDSCGIIIYLGSATALLHHLCRQLAMVTGKRTCLRAST